MAALIGRQCSVRRNVVVERRKFSQDIRRVLDAPNTMGISYEYIRDFSAVDLRDVPVGIPQPVVGTTGLILDCGLQEVLLGAWCGF